MDPKVSVILPVYNGEKFLKEAIESVLAQDYSNLELIVVDDGSSDHSAEIARRFSGLSYLYQSNAGVAAARNKGIATAAGDYVAFIDADDLWTRDKLSKQIAYMNQHPEIGYSFSKHSLLLADGLREMPDWVRKDQAATEMTAYIPSALVVRSRVLRFIGGFNEGCRVGEDSDWFLRARDAGIKLAVLEDNLLIKRVHRDNLTSNTAMARAQLLKSIKASLQRAARGKISVIIPVFNGEKYIVEALESVLNQTLRPFEIIVVDDGSTDGTERITQDYASLIHYIKKPNGGAASARNEGVLMARGDYIAFLDADDYWTPEKLARQLAEAEQAGAAHMIFAMTSQFFSPDTDEAFRSRYLCDETPSSGMHPGTLLIRREDFLRVGLFSTDLKTGEFIDWYCRARELGLSEKMIPEVLMYRRLHEANHGILEKRENQDYARIIVNVNEKVYHLILN